ncbi:(2Fe-2S)-binding protein [Actinomadura vinacea]|uniref:Bacterioferritin-associated ferredoxin n=1 Tax=Actinomadura vinacea TaxID=115336 RepID=A0ABN3K7D2_9ACTN
MYVCICNAVTEDDVRGCLDGGASSPKDVKDACGMRPGCGSCTKRLYALISEYRTASDLVDAITGGPASPVMPVECTETVSRPVQVAGPTLPVRPSERGSEPTAA